MTRAQGLSLMLALYVAAAEAADPQPSPSTNASTHAPVAPAAHASSAKPAERKPLDLRVGDIRRYMMPNQLRAAIAGDDASVKETIVVEGKAPLLPFKNELDVPGGIIAPFWAIAHPLSAWRIIAPDVNAKPAPPTWDKVPPPTFMSLTPN